MVATFHFHYMGYRIKYGNLGVRNTTQQLLPTTRPCYSTEFIEAFLFLVILVTYNIGIYICIYIYKVSHIHSFFVIFNCNAFSALHAKHFNCWKRILIWQKILEVFGKIYLNIVLWILLWMLTSLVIWNLNITVSTTLK